ncbi:MAG: gamma-glutamyl-gamma-aminobutyrate hydrolase family protein [Marmoricola sp.]
MRPLIGLSTYREPARWGAWNTSADLLPSEYARAVEAAGGVPLLLPPTLPYGPSAEAVVARLDGLIIAGGADVEPERYAEVPHARTGPPRRDRDGWELALLDAAVETGVPVLGICRGMQVMAVHAGGSLDQHVPDLVDHDEHNPGGDTFGRTGVTVTPGSRLSSMVGEGEITVACHHHQSVRTHPGFTAVAAATDGLLEAIEDDRHPFRLAVQWHPEMDPEGGLFTGLVEAASAFAATRP